MSMYSNPPPERIYGWLDTQLSIARFYGGCTYQGHSYSIDRAHPQCPLVREDVLAREAKERQQAKAEAASAAKRGQQSLI